MICPVPPGNEHFPLTVQRDGVPVIVCAKCEQVIG